MSVSASYGRPKPSGGLDLYSWLFMRVSGLVLLFLALGHLVIMHLIHNVEEINYLFVANRYAAWGWRFYDLALLVLAMIHGVNGTRVIMDDYVHTQPWRRLAHGVLYTVCGSLLLLGLYVALFYQPIR